MSTYNWSKKAIEKENQEEEEEEDTLLHSLEAGHWVETAAYLGDEKGQE
jgi:hypothetical protein